MVGIFGSIVGVAEMCSEDHDNGRSCAGAAVALTLIGTGTYAAIGAGIDALIPGRTPIWPGKSGKSAGIAVSFSPQDHGAFVGWRQAIP